MSEPTSVALRPMDPDRLPEWIDAGKAEYRDIRERSGDTPQQAVDNAELSYASSFPDGTPAPGHHVFDVVAGGVRVGALWIGPQSVGDRDNWWVWDVSIDEEFRGRGLGREAMLLAETKVGELGGKVLGLNVFGFNTVARSLYESMGYRTASIRMVKELPDVR